MSYEERVKWNKAVKKANDNPYKVVYPFRASKYEFSELVWSNEKAADFYDSDDPCIPKSKKIKELYPELSSWGDLSIHYAWGWYSQDIYLVGVADIKEREELFLGYLYAVQEKLKTINKWNGDAGIAEDAIKQIFKEEK